MNVSINDDLVGCLNNTKIIKQIKELKNKSNNAGSARNSDASGIYDEIVVSLRDQSNKQLMRPITLLSGLFAKQSTMNNK